MKSTRTSVFLIIVMCAAFAFGAPLGTFVTYEGILTDGGAPVTGTFDLQFGLFDLATGGTNLGTVTADNVSIADGRLAVTVDFDDQWNGDARWLEIGVRDGASTGGFTLLSARQRLRTTPFGFYAMDADSATAADHASSAGSAGLLDGYSSDFYRDFGNVTGVPPGVADGDDDTAADLVCAAGETPSWGGSGWGCAADNPGPHVRTAVIGPVGDAAANGTALLDAIDALPMPSSAAEGWLVEIEPGLYDVGANPLLLPPWITLRGSGTTFTVIQGSICDSAAGSKATILLANGSEIRDMTVSNTCATATGYGRAVVVPASSSGALISHVTATEDGGASCVGVQNLGSDTVMERVIARIEACDGDASAIATMGSNALLLDCEGGATGFGFTYGLAIGGRAWVDRGLFAANSTSGAMQASIAAFTDADIRNVTTGDVWVGAYSTNQVVTLSRSNVVGQVEASDQGGTLLVAVEHSVITSGGATATGDTNTAIGIAMSQLSGSAVSPSGGLIACAGVWDESWVPYANTCP